MYTGGVKQEQESQQGHRGRPRSEQAREAVLHAVDDLLLEQGYAAMTMKNIAERAGVSRQTVYRWWTTKAEILFEASTIDAAEELVVPQTGVALDDLLVYVCTLRQFLVDSPAGLVYRALVGEAQHDKAVAELLSRRNVFYESAWTVISHAAELSDSADREWLVAQLVGPPFFWVLSGQVPERFNAERHAATVLHMLQNQEHSGVRPRNTDTGILTG